MRPDRSTADMTRNSFILESPDRKPSRRFVLDVIWGECRRFRSLKISPQRRNSALLAPFVGPVREKFSALVNAPSLGLAKATLGMIRMLPKRAGNPEKLASATD